MWLDGCPVPVQAWVALDDEDLWSEDTEFMKKHFVKTASNVGLRSNHVHDALFILNNQPNSNMESKVHLSKGNVNASSMV
jgi:hypothetical protein